jgi:uncharacterized protein YkwD
MPVKTALALHYIKLELNSMKKRKIVYLLGVCMALGLQTSVWAGDNDRSGTGDKKADKNKLLVLVNEARAKGCNCGGKYFEPAPPVAWNDKLEIAAEKHCNFMKLNNNLSHTGENGSNAGLRITTAGYKWSAYGENIAVGYASESEVIKGWLNSPSHCKNLMNGEFKDMAVIRNGSYWTQVLASGQ